MVERNPRQTLLTQDWWKQSMLPDPQAATTTTCCPDFHHSLLCSWPAAPVPTVTSVSRHCGHSPPGETRGRLLYLLLLLLHLYLAPTSLIDASLLQLLDRSGVWLIRLKPCPSNSVRVRELEVFQCEADKC